MDHPPAPTAPRGRPVDHGKRDAVAEVARRQFLARGFEGMSMEGVAAEAGVSKVTVYRAFGDRSGLLAAVVAQESRRLEAAFVGLAPAPAEVPAMLLDVASRLLAHLGRPEVQAFDRRIAAETESHPELVRAFFAAGPGRIRDALGEWLQRVGRCASRDEATELAEELMAAWAGALPLDTRFGLAPPPRPQQLQRRLARIIERFGPWAGSG
jgi:TetR/AcrR family transcriptional regulator, mexJK operon transcriptional repressor